MFAGPPQPADHRQPARLVAVDVRPGLEHNLLAGPGMGAHRHQVAHSAGGHEQPRLLTHTLGGQLLETVDRRVLLRHVIAHLGLRHRPSHPWIGHRLGVAAQIDQICPGIGMVSHSFAAKYETTADEMPAAADTGADASILRGLRRASRQEAQHAVGEVAPT